MAWLSSLAKCKNKRKKPLTDHLNPWTLVQMISSHRLTIFSDFLSKNHQKIIRFFLRFVQEKNVSWVKSRFITILAIFPDFCNEQPGLVWA
jgi:hypothetical protein